MIGCVVGFFMCALNSYICYVRGNEKGSVICACLALICVALLLSMKNGLDASEKSRTRP